MRLNIAILGLCICMLCLIQRSAADNWAVIVSTSRYWFNYRHAANSLAIYSVLRKLNYPDSHIILMNSVTVGCDRRNAIHGAIYNKKDLLFDMCGDDVETDFEGDDVNAANFMNVLTGRHSPNTPRHKRLLSNNESRVLVYMSGHGGDEFLKFHDAEEISAYEIGLTLREMSVKQRFKEMLFIVDTCQASTLGNHIGGRVDSSAAPPESAAALAVPGVIFVGSSSRGENSYAYNINEQLGVALVDRFSFGMFEFFRSRIGLDFSATDAHTGSGASDSDSETEADVGGAGDYGGLLDLLAVDTRPAGTGAKVPRATPTTGSSRNSLPPDIALRLKRTTLQDLLGSMDARYLYSNVFVKRSTASARDPATIPLWDYFTFTSSGAAR